MFNRASLILSVFFILMLAASMSFAGDQLKGEVAGINSTAVTFKGYIVKLEWYTAGTTQLRMTAKSPHGILQVFVVNSLTRIDINGRIAGPKELNVGDVVNVTYGQNNVASQVSVKRPGPGNVVKMNCKIEEIRISGPYYIFVMESLGSTAYYYELTITPDSKLWRDGRPADPSEFQIGDVGTARFYLSDLKVLSFISISPHAN